MPGRPDLDISDILKHYEVFGGSNRAGLSEDQIELQRLEQERLAKLREDQPQVEGFGPLAASTCTALALAPEWCWDVNGYYRSLGVHWKATRGELMRAYQVLDGPNSVYLTYVLKQLLNTSVRRSYDMTPLGQLFLDDIFIQQAIKKAAVKEAAERSAAGVPVTAEEVIAEKFAYEPPSPLDENANNDETDPSLDLGPWPFAYFVWRSKRAETNILAEWQALIIRSVAERGGHLHFAVGFMGKQPHRYLVGRVGRLQVAFLSDKECPTPGLASAAAHALMNDMH